MEKRLVVFLLCSVLIMTGYGFLKVRFAPPKPVAEKGAGENAGKGPQKDDNEKDGAKIDGAEKDAAEKDGAKIDAAEKDAAEKEPEVTPDPKAGDGTPPGDEPLDAKIPAEKEPAKVVEPQVPPQWITIGSFFSDPSSPYRLLVTFSNRGAAVERVELVERRENGSLRYGDLTNSYGYLGLQCRDTKRGCEVKVVGRGTPVAMAKSDDGTLASGLLVGDVIEAIDRIKIASAADLDRFLEGTKAKQIVDIRVRRTADDDSETTLQMKATLDQRPLELIQPESTAGAPPHLSFLLGLDAVGDERTDLSDAELPGYESLRESHWEVGETDIDGVVFRKRIRLGKGADADELEFIKRYSLVAAKPNQEDSDLHREAYQLAMSVEVVNHSQKEKTVSYVMDGPTGLPIEGWWYSNKINPGWGMAGARDVIWRVTGNKHKLLSASDIYKATKEEGAAAYTSILTDQPTVDDRTFDYIGVDTQYFAAVLMAGQWGSKDPLICRDAFAIPVGEVGTLKGRAVRKLNTTCRFVSTDATLAAGETVKHQYHIFLGPKSTPLLAEYGLTDIIEYGWFGWVAKPLSKLLHFFYYLVSNYGIAIILLTVLVRGLMFPIGRKAARNAQMMQELAPEIKKIKEKYKNDLEKQGQAQRELWKKNDFNPLGGCWLMFLQLPIFIGLYRSLSVDIELRQASLIPGVQWCSNLAGPDMFLYWKEFMPGFIGSETSWFGPYLNILPIVTIVLFIAQQKMFTPPATDDQTRMQQTMMKYMMVFMGVLFFKVASGLCIYFIASSLWGIAERKLLPKPAPKSETEGKPKTPVDAPEKKSLVQRFAKKTKENADEIRARRKKRR